MLGAGCVEPQPQTLTLPRADDQDEKVRQAMVEFNEARFQEECAAIDSAVFKTGLPSDILPGGVLLQRGTTAPAMQKGLRGWQAARGDLVIWAWEAYTLDGSLLTSGADEFEVDRGAVPVRFMKRLNLWPRCGGRCVVAFGLGLGVRGTRRDLTVTPVRLHCVKLDPCKTRVVGRSAARCFGRSFLAQKRSPIDEKAGATC